jgi:hypothetical protein
VGKFTTVAFAARDQAKAERIKATIMAIGCGDVDYILSDLSNVPLSILSGERVTTQGRHTIRGRRFDSVGTEAMNWLCD